MRSSGADTMTTDIEYCRHALPGQGLYFVLQAPLIAEQFFDALSVLARHGAERRTVATTEDHWAALQARARGERAWQAIAPRIPNPATPEALREQYLRQNGVENLLRLQPYTAWSAAGIQYVFDWFNPANELGVPYRDHEAPVLVLRLREESFGTVQNELAGNETFYAIVADLYRLLQPRVVCGTYSMFRPIWAYVQNQLPLDLSPWELFYQFSILRRPTELPPNVAREKGARTTNDSLALLWPVFRDPRFPRAPLSQRFAKVLPIDADSLLLQVRRGIDAFVDDAEAEIGRMLGMRPVQDLHQLPLYR
jgi:hypothetical protein